MVEGVRKRRWPWWLGFFAVLALGLHLTVRAYREQLPPLFSVDGVDKVVHAVMAGSLAFFLDGALGQRDLRMGRLALPLSMVLVLAPVGLEEILQGLSVSRNSSIRDFLADVAGVVVLCPLSRVVARALAKSA